MMKFKFRLAHFVTLLLAFMIVVLPARAQKASLVEEDLIANCANQLNAYTESRIGELESRLAILIEQRDAYIPKPGDNPERIRTFELRSKLVADRQELIARLKKERSSRGATSLGFGTAYETANFINNMDTGLLRKTVLGLRQEMRSGASRLEDEWRLCTLSLRLALLDGKNVAEKASTPTVNGQQPGAVNVASQGKVGSTSKGHNRANEASNCIKVYGPAEMKALGMRDVLASKMVNSCPFSVSVTWCVASSAARRGNCNPGYSNLHNLSGVGEQGSNTYGVDAVDQTVHFAACKYGRDMGFLPIELDRQNPFRFACK